MKAKTILVDLEGFKYLQCKFRKQGGLEITPHYIQFLDKAFKNASLVINSKGEKYKELYKHSLGWSVEEMAKMLDKANLPYEFGPADIIMI